jgi:hypothetical protein
MILAPVAPVPEQERVGECPRPLLNACQRLFPADGWMHNNLWMFVGEGRVRPGGHAIRRFDARPTRWSSMVARCDDTGERGAIGAMRRAV